MADHITHNIVTTETDDAIVAAVQTKIGASSAQGYSTAIRFIIREWARVSGLQETLYTAAATQPTKKPRSIKPSARNRARARKSSIDGIPGVTRGTASSRSGGKAA
jgi:hypothetical protein